MYHKIGLGVLMLMSLSIIFKFYCGGHDLLMKETGVPWDNQ